MVSLASASLELVGLSCAGLDLVDLDLVGLEISGLGFVDGGALAAGGDSYRYNCHLWGSRPYFGAVLRCLWGIGVGIKGEMG